MRREITLRSHFAFNAYKIKIFYDLGTVQVQRKREERVHLTV